MTKDAEPRMTIRQRINAAAKLAGLWASGQESPYNRFILCMPAQYETELWEEVCLGDHPNWLKSFATEWGLTSLPRWDGFLVAWNTDRFGFVEVKDAPRDILARALTVLAAAHPALPPIPGRDLLRPFGITHTVDLKPDLQAGLPPCEFLHEYGLPREPALERAAD